MGENDQQAENSDNCRKNGQQLKSREMTGSLRLLIDLSIISCVSIFSNYKFKPYCHPKSQPPVTPLNLVDPFLARSLLSPPPLCKIYMCVGGKREERTDK